MYRSFIVEKKRKCSKELLENFFDKKTRHRTDKPFVYFEKRVEEFNYFSRIKKKIFRSIEWSNAYLTISRAHFLKLIFSFLGTNINHDESFHNGGGKSRFRGGGGENALIRDVSGAEIQADWYRPTLFIRIS